MSGFVGGHGESHFLGRCNCNGRVRETKEAEVAATRADGVRDPGFRQRAISILHGHVAMAEHYELHITRRAGHDAGDEDRS